MRKKKKKQNNTPISSLETFVYQWVQKNPNKTFTIKELLKKANINGKKAQKDLIKILRPLQKARKIEQKSEGVYITKQLDKHIISILGTIDYVNPKFGYLVSDELEEDIWIASKDMNSALDGDLVKLIITKPKKRGKKVEGRVIEIIERKKQEFVGQVELSDRFAFVIPDSKKMHQDIFVHLGDTKGAKKNDKVVVKITEWPSDKKSPVGKITRILGPAGENETEIHAIIAEFDLPNAFPEDVIKESENISEKIDPKEIEKRKDFREITTFTIDPEDAKDFDDAISIQILDNGHYKVGIHIADVTHYVQPKTALDEEAFKRGTSVYLVDRTIPMLPERLSNQLCSLRPQEEKLTFSAVFELDQNASVVNEWFGRTIIYSDRRFTYEEAQQRIETVSGDFAKELTILNELALKLKVDRFMRGSINFEKSEVKFKLGEKGKPLAIIPKDRKDAHKLVEEFMLLANKHVAQYVYKYKSGKEKNTFVYRTHDYPDMEKLNAFGAFAKKFGHTLHVEEANIAKSLNNLIEDIQGKPEQDVLQILAIRTMAKATYTTKAQGHFGLAFSHYTHFTSPIRRYPDMMVHRLLFQYLNNQAPPDRMIYEKKCTHASDREKIAADAERASIKFKQVEFMQKFINETFDGLVSGLTDWGIYVEIVQTKCEGMVRLSDLTDDYYEFDETNYRIIGQKNKKMITLGDDVRVKVVRTDIQKRTIDLELVD